MRKLWIIFLGLVFLASCKNKDEFQIKGSLENIGNAKLVYLCVTNPENRLIPIDSTYLNENHEFIFKNNSLEPNFYQILIGQKSYLVIAENGDVINFKANLDDQTASYTLTGTNEADKLTAYNKITSEFSSASGNLAERYSKMISQNPDQKDAIIEEFNAKSQLLTESFLKQSYQFIKANQKSLTAFYAANILYGMDNKGVYEIGLIEYGKEAKKAFPNNGNIAAFVQELAKAEKIAIGKLAPEIVALNPDGKTIKLSDYRGKYVLLDFWASWCAPCRQENPNIVKQYQLFKNQNFTVLGFSLDEDAKQWKTAIENDHLTWNHFSELKQWDAEAVMNYNVSAIPASFLINPNGIIVAKNLRGDALHQFLEKNLR